MRNSKVRGQKRRLNSLLNNIDKIQPSFDYIGEYEHFHVPCGWWISEPKTSSGVKTEFCKKWLKKTQEIINSKPKNNKFCRVVADITSPCFWNSQISVDISHILGNLITVIFNYQILRKPLKILSL